MSHVRLALSPSRAADYQRCPLMYRFKAIDKLPEPKTVAQLKGTLVHAVLEDMYELPADERTYPVAVKMLKPQWQKMVEKDPEAQDVVPDDSLMEMLTDARELIKGYFQMENPQGFDPAATEMPIDETLPNDVPIRGFIDRVDIAPTGEVRVVDYKTGKFPAPQWSQDAIFQMKFYALAYWRRTGTLPSQLKLMYIKSGKDKTLSPQPAELEYFEKSLATLWAKISADVQSGEFSPKVNNLCNWCAFQEYCPEKGGTPPEYPLTSE